MPDLIIKPTTTSGNKLILQDQAGGTVLTTADSGATIGGATIINTSESGTFGKDVTVGNSSAGATVLKVLGGEAGTAEVNLFPDQADDNPDKWKIVGKTDSSFQISTYNSGAYLPALTFQPDQSVNGAHTILGEFQSGRTFTNVQLQVNDVQNNAPIIALVGQAASPNAGARNWCMRPNAVNYGDFCFFNSADSTGTPIQGDPKLSIQNNGSIGLGGTSNTSLDNNQIYIDMTNARYNVRSAGSASQDKKVFSLVCGSNGEVGHITLGPSSTNFSTSSDYRLKENVVAMSGSITRLKELKPIKFNFIGWKDTTVDGFLAHEAKEVVPEAVTGKKDAMTEAVLYSEEDKLPDGKSIGDVKEAEKIDPQAIDQSKLVPLLVGALQEAVTRIEALESA